MIQSARTELKLDKTFGCAPKDYWMSRAAYPSNDSIFTLLEEKVLTDVVRDESREDKPRLAIINTGAIRFDICEGPFTRDSTFIVFPFTSGFRYLKNGPTEQAYKLLSISNNGGQILDKMSSDLQSRMLASPEQAAIRANIAKAASASFDGQQRLSFSPDLTLGYTTKR